MTMLDRNAFKAAIGAPDEGFNRAVEAALREIREREERPVMKRKISVGLLVAIIAALALTGAALAVGLNLFELFGKRDARLAQIADNAVLETDMPGEVETEKTADRQRLLRRTEPDRGLHPGRRQALRALHAHAAGAGEDGARGGRLAAL